MSRSSSRAFVLLELLVALTIMGMGFSVLFASMSGAARNIERLERYQRREQLAKNLLAQLDLIQTLSPGDSASGVFDDGSQWRIEIHPFVQTIQDPTGIVRIVLRLEWDGASGPQVRTIETYRLGRKAPVIRGLADQLHELQ